jgi:hypothetical protein
MIPRFIREFIQSIDPMGWVFFYMVALGWATVAFAQIAKAMR